MSITPVDKVKITALLLRFLLFLNDSDASSTFQAATNQEVEGLQEFHPLEATASLLVIEHDIIATAYFSSAIKVQTQSEPETDLDVAVCNTASQTDELHPLKIVIICNPNSDSGDGSSDPKFRLVSLEHVVDFWPEVKKNPWSPIESK